MRRLTLGDVCKKETSGIAQKDLKNVNGKYPIFGASGLIKHVDFYQQEKKYIAVVKDGAGIGRTMLLPGHSSVIGTLQYIIPKDNNEIDIDYLFYAINFMKLEKYFSGATIPHIYFKDYQREPLKLPELDEQKKISSLFKRIDVLLENRRKQLEKYELLIKSEFVEMFGDPVVNEKGWPKKLLSDIGSCKNGMNFNNNEQGVEIHCLGVGDFKDNSVINDCSDLPIISLNEEPSKDYLLENGDIVFVRSNGNKKLVGRSIAIYPQDVPTTFSGFCIRFRKNDKSVETLYLLNILKQDSIRRKMQGRGANIQNLNQQILGSLEIPLPPLDLQNKFAAFVQQVDKSELAVQQSLEQLETLKKSLMQEYFG